MSSPWVPSDTSSILQAFQGVVDASDNEQNSDDGWGIIVLVCSGLNSIPTP